ncbi:DUF58 domain-containing protein [Oerskovia jenensis]|uniref:Uncharacterized protein (DUF58 family) n=1 Tax=Oerskovia jenensis TaxID=162169 RepID=A0ABS2LGU6_9CELL|nr:DUF58 domain-containing protein [Oerskovia jenensis]MBM7479645.1 uncharacterized protein (DUF58 family) [Oerskovia jenensis]
MTDVSRLAQVRARLELPLARRASGLLEGRHRSILKGHGQDFDDLHLYAPGEDVGDIDWKSSARAGIPVVRRFVRESNVNLVLVVDTGRNMGATAASGEPKADVVSFCCALVAYLARDRGDRVALVAGDAERIVQLPPRASTQDLELLLRTVEKQLRVDAPPSDLNRALDRALNAFRRRSLMVVLTDEARPGPEHERLLRRLRVRHEVMVVAVADLSPVGAPADPSARTTGQVADVDGTLDLPPFLRGRADIAAGAAQAARSRRGAVVDLLRTLQVEAVSVTGTGDVVPRFVELLGRAKRAGR